MTCKHCNERRNRATVSGAVVESAVNTTIKSWTALPLLNTTELPEDLDLIGGSNQEFQSWRIPLKLILPNGTLNPSTYQISAANGTIEIPVGQVVPVYIPSSISAAEPAIANNADTTAQVLAIAADDKHITLQGNGFLKFARPHLYEIGKTYYLSQDVAGEVVSCRPNAGIVQPLFTVIDSLTILVNVALY